MAEPATPVEAPPDLVLQAKTVLTLTGNPVSPGAVVIRNGKIAAVTPAGQSAQDTQVIDFGDAVIMPGMIDCCSRLFLLGAEARAGDRVAPHFDLADGLDAYDRAREQVLAQGITCVYVSPGSVGTLGGQTVLVKLNGAELPTELVVKRCAVKGDIGVSHDNTSSSIARLSEYVAIREELLATRRYMDDLERHERAQRLYDEQQAKKDQPAEAETAPKKGENDDANGGKQKNDKKRDRPTPFKRDPVREALARVLRGELPLQLEVRREDAIRNALRLNEEFGTSLILEGATEAYRLADEIAAANTAVIVTPTARSFRLFPQLDLRHETEANAGILHKTGVPVLLGTGGQTGKQSQFLSVALATAIRGGLSRAAALRSVTSEAARVLGVGDRLGRLAPGLDADLVVWTADPLAPASRVRAVYVDGKLVYGGAP